MQKVNVLECELDEGHERGTIAARYARLGARRIGAGLYEIDAGSWVWPYHYHHGVAK